MPGAKFESEAKSARAATLGLQGVARIRDAFRNTLRGLRVGASSEAAIRQELTISVVALPLSFVIASDLWIWVALIASLLAVLAVEFLNTAVERLCNYVQPECHDAIRSVKDLASASVFFVLALAGLVWIAATWHRFV